MASPLPPLDDAKYIASTAALASRSTRPIHSHFLVSATVVYVDQEGQERSVEGVNTETCVLSSCICAERTALVQLRLAPTGWRYVRGVYITASCEALITPGLLCREFLSEFSEATAAVREGHLGQQLTPPADPAGDIAIVLFSASGSATARHWLSELYPHPPLYHGVPNAQLAGVGQAFAQGVAEAASGAALAAALAGARLPAAPAAALALHQAVARLAAEPHEMDDLYPVHLAAGALFSDGESVLARQLKGLEYGCSADAVVRLTGSFGRGRQVALLLQCDQHGNCIAPSAPARSLLTEHAERLGVQHALVLLHTPRGAQQGRLVALPPAALASDAPEIKTGVRAAMSSSGGGSPVPKASAQ